MLILYILSIGIGLSLALIIWLLIVTKKENSKIDWMEKLK